MHAIELNHKAIRLVNQPAHFANCLRQSSREYLGKRKVEQTSCSYQININAPSTTSPNLTALNAI
jgi:hypothetical protein